MEERYLTLKETADRLKLTYLTVRKYDHLGKFRGVRKVGRNKLVPESEVRRWEQQATSKTVYRSTQ